MGSFETEITHWFQNLRNSIYKHERFTWINLSLSIIPSPVIAFIAILLAALQLYLCFKGKIPKSEKNILFVSLILGLINLILSSLLLIYLVNHGWGLWHMFNPFWWIYPLKQKLQNQDIVNVLTMVVVK